MSIAIMQRVIAAITSPEDKPYLWSWTTIAATNLCKRKRELRITSFLIPTQSASQPCSEESLWALFKKIFGSKATSLVNKTRNQGEIACLGESIASRVAQLRASFLKRASFCRVHS